MEWIRPFRELTLADRAEVGGNCASLGELARELGPAGVRVPDGFAVTAGGCRAFLDHAGLIGPISDLLAGVDLDDAAGLKERARRLRERVLAASLPAPLTREIETAYRELALACERDDPYVAVRSASAAGRHPCRLDVRGRGELVSAIVRCFASQLCAEVIRDRRAPDLAPAVALAVQLVVRADRASAGVILTLDPESGSRDVVQISSVWGFGQGVVQRRVSPDVVLVHKPTLRDGYRPVVCKRLGAKETAVIYDDSDRLQTVPTTAEQRARLSLSDDDALTLARWAVAIEDHFSAVRGEATPMALEWAKNGDTGSLYIVGVQPEPLCDHEPSASLATYQLEGRGLVVVEGAAIGETIAAGVAHRIARVDDIGELAAGEVLVTEATGPDWEPEIEKASAIITERGGRASHAAMLAREVGIPAIVGAVGAVERITNGDEITVSCAEGEVGRVYGGRLPFAKIAIDASSLPHTRTRIMLDLARPELAFAAARLPSDGVGLARMEPVLAASVGVHPQALLRFDTLPIRVKRAIEARTDGAADKIELFVDRLSQGIATMAAAFYPRPVILRLSDFKTSDYARLIGGELFEPDETNPAIGWRGASRYSHPDFAGAFGLEAAAIKRVRDDMGLTNLKLMVPFCRTPDEGAAVLEVAAGGGLIRGERDLEVYVMAEIPSNVLLADRFAELFDGFVIGSDDLTQLVLGIDRDSEWIAALFDERDEAVKRACAILIDAAHDAGRQVGICGQAPSAYPDFAAFLVERGIDSISLAPEALLTTRRRIAEVENHLDDVKDQTW